MMNVMTRRVICSGVRKDRIFKAITYLIIGKINQSFHGEPLLYVTDVFLQINTSHYTISIK